MATIIDLNCDCGESFGAWVMGDDARVLPHVTSANIACGAHAGDPVVMRRTVRLARNLGVHAGAHPGFPDLQGFGRRAMPLTPDEVYAAVLAQIGALHAIARAEGATLTHVKPHGALYHSGVEFPDVARAIAEGVRRFRPSLVLVGAAASMLIEAGREAGLAVAEEAFADRRYQADGSTVPRGEAGALITDPDEAAEQSVLLARDRVAIAADGSRISVRADTLCLHGDTPGAEKIARRIHERFRAEGIRIAPLDPGRASRREGVVIPPG